MTVGGGCQGEISNFIGWEIQAVERRLPARHFLVLPPRRRHHPRDRTLEIHFDDEDENESEEDFNLQLSVAGGFRYGK
jgi:hypothetical protein